MIIIIKEFPNIHLIKFIKEVKNNYDGIVTIVNNFNKNNELLTINNQLHNDILLQLFINLQNKINNKKSNELLFIYMNNKKQIEILQNKYQTVTIDKDFIFDILETNNIKNITNKFLKQIIKY